MSDTVYDCPNYPLLLILSGPSGVGKDTVARMLIERRPDSFYFVVTATTRPPRDNEHHGVDYIFVTFDEFARMIEENMWRAIRYGRDGNLLDLQRLCEQPVDGAVEDLLTWTAPVRAELSIAAQLPADNGAQRQRAHEIGAQACCLIEGPPVAVVEQVRAAAPGAEPGAAGVADRDVDVSDVAVWHDVLLRRLGLAVARPVT